METIKVGKYIYQKSNRKDKKLMTVVNGKIIHFGSNMEHFKDKTNLVKGLNHNDIKRRDNYRARAKGIKDAQGKLTYMNPNFANYHSYHILW